MAGSVGDGEFGFQIAPMLDILFVLLLFFMVSAGAQKHETSLTTELPGSGAPGPKVPVQLGIDGDGQVNISSVPYDSPSNHDLPETLARLKEIVQDDAARPIIVTPSRGTRHQRVMDVLNACAVAGVKNLAFGSPTD
jgi:biopolymer transport protein ExbD